MTTEFYEELRKSAGYDKKDRLRGYLWKVYDNRSGMGKVPVYFWNKKNAEEFAEQDYTSKVCLAKFNMKDYESAELYVTKSVNDLGGAALIALA